MADADALRASHGQLPAVLLSRSSILIALDQQGVVLLWNAGAERTFGLPEELILGQPFSRCAIAWDWDRIEGLAPGGLSDREQRIIQPYMRRDGTTGLVAMQVKPQFDATGVQTGCLWLGSDASRVPAGAAAAPGRGVAPPPPAQRAAVRSQPVPRTPAPEHVIQAGASEHARRYPVHISFLDSHLVSQGEDLSQWRILHAEESRLDERGMEVCFTLARRYPAQGVICRRILIASGELVAIQDR